VLKAHGLAADSTPIKRRLRGAAVELLAEHRLLESTHPLTHPLSGRTARHSSHLITKTHTLLPLLLVLKAHGLAADNTSRSSGTAVEDSWRYRPGGHSNDYLRAWHAWRAWRKEEEAEVLAM
jgi:hypothetical protein